MIQSIVISGVKYTPDEQVKKYITKKIGRLDRFLPRHARKSAKAEVILKEVNRDHGNKYEAEIILHVPDKKITAKDSTINMYAVIDIIESKLKHQLSKYKATTGRGSGSGRHGILRQVKLRLARGDALR